MIRAEIKALQRHLNQSGYGPLVEDGIYGPATQAAHKWQLDEQLRHGPILTPPAAKPWWTSSAMWGSLTTIGLYIAGIFIDVSGIEAGPITYALVRISTGIAGLLESVETLMQSPETNMLAKLAWQDAQEFRRDSPTMLAMAGALNLTAAQIDELFITAAGIEA